MLFSNWLCYSSPQQNINSPLLAHGVAKLSLWRVIIARADLGENICFLTALIFLKSLRLSLWNTGPRSSCDFVDISVWVAELQFRLQKYFPPPRGVLERYSLPKIMQSSLQIVDSLYSDQSDQQNGYPAMEHCTPLINKASFIAYCLRHCFFLEEKLGYLMWFKVRWSRIRSEGSREHWGIFRQRQTVLDYRIGFILICEEILCWNIMSQCSGPPF